MAFLFIQVAQSKGWMMRIYKRQEQPPSLLRQSTKEQEQGQLHPRMHNCIFWSTRGRAYSWIHHATKHIICRLSLKCTQIIIVPRFSNSTTLHWCQLICRPHNSLGARWGSPLGHVHIALPNVPTEVVIITILHLIGTSANWMTLLIPLEFFSSP